MSKNTNNEHPSVKKIEITVINRGKGVDYNSNTKKYDDFIFELNCPNPNHAINNNSESAGFQFRDKLEQAISKQQTSVNFNADCSGDETVSTNDDEPALPCSNTIKVNVVVEYM